MVQYIDKDAVMAEIERLKGCKKSDWHFDEFDEGYKSALEDILSIIDSLNVEEVDSTDVFIDKACEWLRNNSHNYAGNALGKEYLVNDFKSYMKVEVTL